MIAYAVVWTALACPGGWASGFIPPALKPIVCDSVRTFQLYDPARLKEAKVQIWTLGPGSELQACRGVDKCRTISKWVVKFEGDK